MRWRALALLLAAGGCAPQVVVTAFPIPLPPPCDGRFDVVNQSSRTVRQFLARPGPGAPEADLLGLSRLPPGAFVPVAAPPGPVDLRAVFDDGTQWALSRADSCALEAVLVTDGGLRPR